MLTLLEYFQKHKRTLFLLLFYILCFSSGCLASFLFFHNISPKKYSQENPPVISISYQRDIIKYLEDYADAALRGNFFEAEQIMRNAIIQYPNFPLFYYNLFISLDKQGKTDEARLSLQKFIKMDPFEIDSNPELRYYLNKYGLKVGE